MLKFFVSKNLEKKIPNRKQPGSAHHASGCLIHITSDSKPQIKDRPIEIAAEQVKGKPENVVEKIINGKLEKFFAENCLMEQAFVKDPDRTIEQVRTNLVGVIGENVEVRRFVRFQLGETTVAD